MINGSYNEEGPVLPRKLQSTLYSVANGRVRHRTITLINRYLHPRRSAKTITVPTNPWTPGLMTIPGRSPDKHFAQERSHKRYRRLTVIFYLVNSPIRKILDPLRPILRDSEAFWGPNAHDKTVAHNWSFWRIRLTHRRLSDALLH